MSSSLRHLVRSPRQVEVGDLDGSTMAPDGIDELGIGEQPEVGEERSGFRGVLRDLDPRSVGATRPIIVFAILGTIGQIDDQVIGLVGPEIQAEFGVTIGFISALATLLAVTQRFAALPFGYAVDRTSRRIWILRFGAILANLGSLLQGLTPNVLGLASGRFLTGGGAAATEVVSFPLMADYFRASVRARVFSFFYAGAQLSGIVVPVIGALVVEELGWRGAVITFSAIGLLASVGTFLLHEPKRGQHELEELGIDPDDVVATEPVTFGEAYRAMSNVVTLRRLWYVTPMTTIVQGGGLIVLAFTLANVYGLTIVQRGLVSAATAALGLVGLIFAGAIADRLLVRNPGAIMTLAGLSYLLQAIGYVLIVVFKQPAVGIAIAIPVNLGSIVLGPAFLSLISQVVPPRMRAMGLQTQAPWQLLGLLLVPIYVQRSVDALGLGQAFLAFVPLQLIAAGILASAAGHVRADIDRALQASVVGIELAESGRDGRVRPLLACRSVEVSYDGVQVLFGVDLDVAEGEVVALLGTNGAGKSTVLRAIAGLHGASSGAILFDDLEITHRPPHELARRGIGYLPGGNAVLADLSVRENLALATDDGDISAALEVFTEIAEALDRPAGALSGGEQQMVALGQALITKPRLLLIDELSIGLAPIVVSRLLAALEVLRADGTTIVVVEQSLNVAARVADRAIFLDRGRVMFDGPVEQLMARPDLVRSVFLGGAGGQATAKKPRVVVDPVDDLPVLEVSGASIAFGGKQALDDASLLLRRNEVVGIIGPNGAGKTTLFDVVSGFVMPDSGTVAVDGVDVTGTRPAERAAAGLGRSFQRARLFPNMTVSEAIAAFGHGRVVGNPISAALRLPEIRRAERLLGTRVEDLIDLVGLGDVAERRVGELSTGQRRIVDVACVLSQKPIALLLDEPTTGLAQAETEALGPLVLRLVRELGCGVAIIEHDVGLVASLSDRMIAMETGRIIAEGTPDEVLAHPEVMRSYLEATEGTWQRSARGADLVGGLLTGTDEA